MKKTKLLKSILIPTLGIATIGTVAISTSCSCVADEKQDSYVILTANADSTVELINNDENNPDLSYSTDLAHWNTYSTQIKIDKDQTYYLKGNNPNGWSTSESKYSCLSITGDVSISGNVMGLLGNGTIPGKQGDITAIPCNYCFFNLFENSTGITSVSEDFLPAMNLADHCYDGMFDKCSSLTTTPELPATTLAKGCYSTMFQNCTSLTTTPELPATKLVESCYYDMFENCTSLQIAPDLPATALAESCYESMFWSCSNLKTAPKLPATTLVDYCYTYMFSDCMSLTTAPELPATTLAVRCYSGMFNGCASLNSIKIGYKSNYSDDYFYMWVDNVAESGTFYYNGDQTAQDFNLPSGWETKKF